MKLARFEVFEAYAPRRRLRAPRYWWFWRLVAPNGRKVAAGGEPFARSDSAVMACRSIARMLGAPPPRVRIIRNTDYTSSSKRNTSRKRARNT